MTCEKGGIIYIYIYIIDIFILLRSSLRVSFLSFFVFEASSSCPWSASAYVIIIYITSIKLSEQLSKQLSLHVSEVGHKTRLKSAKVYAGRTFEIFLTRLPESQCLKPCF